VWSLDLTVTTEHSIVIGKNHIGVVIHEVDECKVKTAGRQMQLEKNIVGEALGNPVALGTLELS